MKNILIITIGTRDVQLRRDWIEQSDEWTIEKKQDVKTGFEQTVIERRGMQLRVSTSEDFPAYYTLMPRLAGLIVRDNPSIFQDVLELPLITPVIKKLQLDEKKVDTVLLIYTNQQSEFESGHVKKRFYNNDTLYFSDIIETQLRQHPLLENAAFDQYEIFEKVADIDHQYEQFREKNHSLFENEKQINEIFLLPQGGIDQVNQAITLQLIQAFKHQVELYQKPDGKEPIILSFTHQFLNDLNKQKILKHLDDYDFGLVENLLSVEHPNKVMIDALAKFAYCKLNLNYAGFPPGIPNQFKEKPISTETRCRDLYLSAKILYYQHDYGNYLFRTYTLLENLYRLKFDQVLGNTDTYYDSKFDNPTIENLQWLNLLRNYDPTALVDEKTLFDYLLNVKVAGRNLKVNNPNRHLYKYGYGFLIRSGALLDDTHYVSLLEKADKTLSQLSNFRNKATHNLAPVSIEQLNNAIGKGKLDELNQNLDAIFNITGFGIYDTIRDEIKNLL